MTTTTKHDRHSDNVGDENAYDHDGDNGDNDDVDGDDWCWWLR